MFVDNKLESFGFGWLRQRQFQQKSYQKRERVRVYNKRTYIRKLYTPMNEDWKEKDHYDEIAKALASLISGNLGKSDKYTVKSLIGEISSALRTLIANGYDAGEVLKDYSERVHRLFLDVSILVENKSNGKFEIIIFEVKKGTKLGLNELAQLIGYCLVSKQKFGVLVNVDDGVSENFSIILQGDPNLTTIERLIDGEVLRHEMGVMVWNSHTKNFEYTQTAAIKNIPDLVTKIEASLK